MFQVSVTLLQVCTSVGSESIMATRLIPEDVLGTEYFAVTLCNVDLCQIQVCSQLQYAFGNFSVKLIRVSCVTKCVLLKLTKYSKAEQMKLS